MSDLDHERLRRVAVNSVSSRRPAATDTGLEAALRFRPGAGVFDVLRRRTRRDDSVDDPSGTAS
jgi:hypothetical protein